MGEDNKKLSAFLEWATKLGVSDSPSPFSSSPSPSQTSSCLGHSLFVSQFPEAGGRGLAAARDLRKGELVLTVPRAALMTRENILRDQRLASYVKKYSHLSSTQILAVGLLAEVEKGRGSQWGPYLMQLPRTYCLLSGFTQFEIHALQVDDAIWASEKAISKARSDWKDAVLLMQEIGLKRELLMFKSWFWASATISSRTLHIPWDDAGCLCPVGDFFNYAVPEESFCSKEESCPLLINSTDEDANTAENCRSCARLTDGGYDEDLGAYCFYARKNYRKGEQVLLCYGTYTNLELLEHYGFFLNANANDKAFIPLDMGTRSLTSWSVDSLYIQQDGKPSFALLSALRLWTTPPKLRRAVGHLAYSGSLLSVENEILVMNWLANSCKGVLSKMPTSIEEDRLLMLTLNQMLGGKFQELADTIACEAELCEFFHVNGLQNSIDSSLSSSKVRMSLERWKLAVQWRCSYKKVLSDCVSYCTDQMIKYLNSQNVPHEKEFKAKLGS